MTELQKWIETIDKGQIMFGELGSPLEKSMVKFILTLAQALQTDLTALEERINTKLHKIDTHGRLPVENKDAKTD